MGNTIDITARKQAELEKAQLTEKLSLALRATGMGIWLIDLKTCRVEADSAAKILHGLAPDEPVATGEQARRNMHPDDIPEVRRKFWPAFETRGSFEIEYRVILPDGKIRWIAGRGEVPEGSPYLIGTLRDITDRKLAEARVADRASEERFRGIVSQMAAGVCRLAFNGTVTFANEKFCNMLGYDRATELVGKTSRNWPTAVCTLKICVCSNACATRARPFNSKSKSCAGTGRPCGRTSVSRRYTIQWASQNPQPP